MVFNMLYYFLFNLKKFFSYFLIKKIYKNPNKNFQILEKYIKKIR